MVRNIVSYFILTLILIILSLHINEKYFGTNFEFRFFNFWTLNRVRTLTKNFSYKYIL